MRMPVQRLALPRKDAMSEMNLHTVAREEIDPEKADLPALRNGIGGDESNTDGKGRAGILPALFGILPKRFFSQLRVSAHHF